MAAASTAWVGTPGGSTSSCSSQVRSWNSSHLGMDTTRADTPSPASVFWAATQIETSEPVPMRTRSRSPGSSTRT